MGGHGDQYHCNLLGPSWCPLTSRATYRCSSGGSLGPTCAGGGDPETNLAEARHLPPGADHALIAAGTSPVGYLRWERVSPRDLADLSLDDIPEGAVDIDIFIGEPAYLGRGVGPRALRLLVARLRADSTVPLAGLYTSVHNTAAIRTYEKAGFTRMRQYDDPESGPCWIMVLPLRSSAD